MRGTLIALLAAAAALAGCDNSWRTQKAVEHYVAGQMAMDRNDYEAALAELAKAVEFDSKLSVAYTAMGDIHRREGDFGQAAWSYQRACEANPYDFRPHYNLGVTYQALAAAAETARSATGYIRKAATVYLRAVTINPKDFDANLNLSACYFQQGKLELAERYCQCAVEAEPNNPHGHSNLGIIYDAQDRPYDAIRAYKASLELDTNQPKLLLNLGTTYMKLRRLKSAAKAFRLSIEQDDEFAPAYEQLGSCLYLQREWDQALSAYEKAVEVDPDSAAAQRGIGVVYMTQYLGDRTREDLRSSALAAWQRSLELDPSQKDLVDLMAKYAPDTPDTPL
jgi:superkiller protein 3